jgi:Peptidase A4 family
MRPLAIRVAAAVAVTGAWATTAVAAAAVSAGPAITHHPRVAAATRAAGWASSNWSGYAITGGPFTSVSGHWTVPTVSASRKATYSSSWVGIDGFNDSNLIQTGTEHDYFNGSAHYSAWWEILPAAETTIAMTVQPGDAMSATITRGSNNNWTISISDTTRNESFSIVKSYSAPLSSAEWIQEAPTVGGRIATLANYGQTTFDPGTANGVSPGLTVADGGVMIQHGVQVSTPSTPDSDTDGFTIAYGSTAPSPPKS